MNKIFAWFSKASKSTYQFIAGYYFNYPLDLYDALVVASPAKRLNIAKYANLDVRLRGWTALMEAIACRRDDIAELLINNGANLNLRNVDGRTILMQAILGGALRHCKVDY